MSMWNYPAWRANTAKALKEKPMANGPWSPETWYPIHPVNLRSWPWWRQFGSMTVSRREEVTHLTTVIDDLGNKTEHSQRLTYYFDAFAAGADIWRGSGSPPAGSNGWRHNSATAWGDGLYDCSGNITCFGLATSTRYETETFTPVEGGGGTTIIADVVNGPFETGFNMGYVSDFAAIDGLDTPCPMVIPYAIIAPGGSHGELFDPPPTGEWSIEKVLRMLAGGNVFADDPVTSGFLTGIYQTTGTWTDEFTCLHDLTIIFT